MNSPKIFYPTIADTVGNTPLVRLQRIPGEGNLIRNNIILGKLEGNNPAGSVKDRPALSMFRHAEQRGQISPGDTLICLLYTSPSPRDRTRSRMPSSA